jgi:HAD superfamily hydrolase (TIGR01484 family)
MPYLVATDLDGTLLRRDFTVSARTRAALRDAARAGVEVVYATGRPPRWLQSVYDTTGHTPITVCANGALTLRDGEPLHFESIPDDVLDEVRELLTSLDSAFSFRTERWRGHVVKLLALLPDADHRRADAVLAEVRDAAGHLVEPTHTAHSRLLIEMGPGGVTKAAALQRVRERFYPQHICIAIGDMPNDLALLQAADIPLTVASGHPVLKAVAVDVLPGPQDDGVAGLLERLARGEDL